MQNKNAIITGSTSGIGLAIAHSLAEEGVNIIFNGFGDKSQIEEIVNSCAKKYNVKALYLDADMRKPSQINNMIETTIKQLGSVDILVNNAGIQFTSPVEDFPDDKWDAIIATNLSSAFHTIKSALPYMKNNNFGRIINIASAHGLVGSVNKSAYVAAKHGVVGLTKVVALEVAKSDITCNAICPGWVYTPLVAKQIEAKAKEKSIAIEDATKELLAEKQPSGRFVTPENIGALVCFLCGPNANTMTGEIISIDGGWTAQ
ncbi:MAG: 3-hydroxybutyrate dehydrogenase [Rickettsiaceae bacterium]|nr:3-hydroxybutyrate dehydrogenase [Rickettsiaceae bacterium]